MKEDCQNPTVVDETSTWGEEEWNALLDRMVDVLPWGRMPDEVPEPMPARLVMHPYAFFLTTEILPLQVLRDHYRRAGNRRRSAEITRHIHRSLREWQLDFNIDIPRIDRLMLARIRYQNPRGVGMIRALRAGHPLHG